MFKKRANHGIIFRIAASIGLGMVKDQVPKPGYASLHRYWLNFAYAYTLA